jgi:hypothetical protein
MPDVNSVSGGPLPPQNQVSDRGVTPPGQTGTPGPNVSAPVGQPGPLGQPTGLPAPPGQPPVILPDVLAGREPSQLAAAEELRARGAASATEELLGLNRQPTAAGALAAPPGNSEALRHLTPAMRRAVMRNLLNKQREQMRHLAALVRRERQDLAGGSGDGGDEEGSETRPEAASDPLGPEATQLARARDELGRAACMLDLLDELLAMQDYAISQMGTFSRG